MANNHHIVSEDEIMKFNLTRTDMRGKEYSQQQMREELNRRMGYSKAAAMLRALCDGINPPIIKVRRGVYAVNPKPVFKDRLQLSWDEYTKFANPQNYKNGKHEPNVSVEQAIKILKEAGYKVLKPVTQYKEI